jgi:hypothetical protein
LNLAQTPEGAAIAAFQEVLDSGCLQVNAVLPVELTRALRKLYMQIDHLINQGSRNEPQWQCMSYGAQIAAHKSRVDEWKEAQAKHQEEMARQQHLAQQQMLLQMGIPPQQQHQPNRHSMSAEQAQQQHAIDLERRRSLQHAAQQPHLTHYLTNPLSLNSQRGAAPTGVGPSPSPVGGPPASSPSTTPANAPSDTQQGLSSKSAADYKSVQLDRIKLYMPNYLPRSGQSMKFSFAPHNELALKAFGPQAFPSNHAGPNLPNRGPMSASPVIPSMPMNINPSAHRSNLPTPVLGANGSPAELKRTPSDKTDVVMTDASNQASQRPVPEPEPKPTTTNGTNTAKDSANHVPAFTAVNASANESRPKSALANSPSAMSPLKQTIETPNGKHVSMPASPAQGNRSAELASRFPHPGAVVVDQ